MVNSLKLNETPVRTARNFNINNIKLNDIKYIENLEKFENTKIINLNENAKIDNQIGNYSFKYGVSKELEDNVQKNANCRFKIDIKNEAEVQIINNFDSNNLSLIDDIEIIANEKSSSNIVIKYSGNNDTEFYHNGRIRINALKNSDVNITIVNLLNTNSQNFLSIENVLEDNANINYCIVDFGGKISITNYYSDISGKGAINNINTIYLGKENQLFDLNYIGELKGEKSEIDIEVQGALKDTAKKHFKGTIDFKKGAKKAKGDENEFCMLLSDKAKSIALPMLLCSEEDVEGNHSSATGKVGNKELFYIMSRGLSKNEAMKLIVKAKFNKILEKIYDEKLRDEILNEIDLRLD